jgi:Flp pilus assembly protein TadG
VVLAVIEFSLILVAQQQVVTASREGARVAAQGGSQDDVTQTVQQFLGGGSLMNATIAAVLTDDTGQRLPSGSPVAVAVSVPATQAVPDLLAFVGYSIQGETLAAQTVMRKE